MEKSLRKGHMRSCRVMLNSKNYKLLIRLIKNIANKNVDQKIRKVMELRLKKLLVINLPRKKQVKPIQKIKRRLLQNIKASVIHHNFQ